MPTFNEQFFTLSRFALVGNTDVRAFPGLSYRNLRALGKTVYAVDLGAASAVDGDRAYGSLDELPGPVDGVILELPRGSQLPLVEQVAQLGIRDLWLHQGTDTPELLERCRAHQIRVRHGTCAVMYTHQGFSVHSIHKAIMKLLGRY